MKAYILPMIHPGANIEYSLYQHYLSTFTIIDAFYLLPYVCMIILLNIIVYVLDNQSDHCPIVLIINILM